MSLINVQNQLPESSANSQSTLEKGRRNPPDVKLDFILEDLLKYLNVFEILCETKTEIEKKCDFKEHDDCWSEDDIKRAWEETRRIDGTLHRALVIVLQILKRQRTKEEDPEERSTQRIAQLEPLEDAQSSGRNDQTSSYLKQQSCASEATEATGNSSSDVEHLIIEDEIMFIRIPYLEMFDNAPTAGDRSDTYVTSRYKLINGFPSGNTVNTTRSYARSFDKFTGNAEWVYEILNRETLKDNCKEISFGDVYVKGHLAAASNHRWCREAYDDTYLLSNLIPQNNTLNNSNWKTLENRCKKMTEEENIHNVHVYTGPLYWRPTLKLVFHGRRKIIPTHLFKMIIVENKDGTVEKPKCYVIPNKEPEEDKTVDKYLMSIDKFQKYSGLKLIEYRLRDIGRERDRIKTVTLRGEDLNQTPRNVNIKVRITHHVNL